MATQLLATNKWKSTTKKGMTMLLLLTKQARKMMNNL